MVQEGTEGMTKEGVKASHVWGSVLNEEYVEEEKKEERKG